jgi:hypothetical protein
MIEYFSTYMSPVSETRAKISVHMMAHKPTATNEILSGSADLVDDEMPSDDAEKFMGKVVPAISAKFGTTPHLIEDVHAFRASLQLSPGGEVIRHLAGFEA